jgi:hypothetical protein
MDWTAIGSIATAIAVFVGAWQVRRNTRQAMTDFEDEFTREYRALVRTLSVEAQLGEEVADAQFKDDYRALVSYIDLSNEQVFLRQNGRVSRETWDSWSVGISANLAKPAFAKAWDRVKANPKSGFAELRRLEKERFEQDPRSWLGASKRLRRWITAG